MAQTVGLPQEAPAAGFSLWDSPPGLHLVQTTRHRHWYPDHLHDGLELIHVQAGEGLVRHCGRTTRLPAGTLYVICPGEPHAGGSPENGTFRFASTLVDRELLNALATDPGIPGGDMANALPARHVTAQDVIWRVEHLHQRCRGGASRLEQESLLLELLHALLGHPGQTTGRRHTSRVREHRAVALIRDYLATHCDEDVDLSTLARLTGLHRHYLIDVFRARTGITPHRFQIAVRVDRVRQLISTGAPLSVIAAETGFADQSHMTRCFKQYLGMTPGYFRSHSVLNHGPRRSA
ncbi:MAG: helix-turn-helix transcriptional regulator [Ectothiorhodospiraceae bacterium]|nr:helix-turn-helix transcriptional regulator [Ectothiorhodospiraceae bacterium]